MFIHEKSSYMNKFYGVIFIIGGLFMSDCTPPKSVIGKESNLVSANPETSKFPDDWMGYWKGELKIYKENELVRSLPMALDLSITDTVGYYTWAIIYGQDAIAGRRDYFLNTVNANIGHYQIDEQNSIILDCYLFDNQLISNFEVGNSKLQSKYTLDGSEMIFEISVSSVLPVAETGNQVIKGDTIPNVKSFAVTTVQKAILHRVVGN